MTVKALLVGINKYPNPKAELKGCVNDVKRMNSLLTETYGVPDANVRELTDSAAIKQAIVDGLAWLGQREAGEEKPVRLFHFSGHGVQVPDAVGGDEEDGTDEALAPYDYTWDNYNSFLLDDELHELYANIGADTHLVVVMDCCHSGTNQRDLENGIISRSLGPDNDERTKIAQDVAARKRDNQKKIKEIAATRIRELWQRDGSLANDQSRFDAMMKQFEQQAREELFGQRDVAGTMVLITACQDRQTAADAHLGGSYNGALTYYLTKTLGDAGEQLAYSALIDQLSSGLSDDPALNAPGFERQIPQLECDTGWRDLLFLRDPMGTRSVSK